MVLLYFNFTRYVYYIGILYFVSWTALYLYVDYHIRCIKSFLVYQVGINYELLMRTL